MKKNNWKRRIAALLIVAMAASLNLSALAKSDKNNGNTNNGKSGVTVHGVGEAIGNSNDPITVQVGDKTYTGTVNGSKISFDMESEDNLLLHGSTIIVKNGDRTFEVEIGEQEGNGGGNGGKDQDKGHNNYKGNVKEPTTPPTEPTTPPTEPTTPPTEPTTPPTEPTTPPTEPTTPPTEPTTPPTEPTTPPTEPTTPPTEPTTPPTEPTTPPTEPTTPPEEPTTPPEEPTTPLEEREIDAVIEIQEDAVPLTNLPEEKTPPVDVPEERVPLVDIPEEDVPLTDIPEEDVPLTDTPEDEPPLGPKTGAEENAVWMFILGIAGMLTTGAALLFLPKKREER